MRLLLYFVAALGALLFGFDTGNIAGALLFIKADFHLGSWAQGWVVSVLLIGAIIGAVGGGRLADRYGRRGVILVVGCVFLVGALGEALSPNVPTLIGFRFLVGLAVGSASVTVPVYIAELAPTESRGRLTSLNQLMVAIGILAGYVDDAALGPFGAWRWMLALGAVPATVMLVAMPFMPETPRWLVNRGRIDDARHVLSKFRDLSSVERELDVIRELHARPAASRVRLRDLLAPWVRPALIAAVGLALFQQITGVNTIIYYAPTILTSMGLGDKAALVTNVGLGVWTLAVTVLEMFLVDRAGRKPLLLLGATGLAISMTVLGTVQITAGFVGGGTATIAVGCLVLFKFAFSIAWGAVPAVITSEIFPRDLRGTAAGLTLGVNWAANFVVSLTFPVLLALGTGAGFFIYAAMAVLAFLFTLRKVPETKGRSLEEIELDLRSGRTQRMPGSQSSGQHCP